MKKSPGHTVNECAKSTVWGQVHWSRACAPDSDNVGSKPAQEPEDLMLLDIPPTDLQFQHHPYQSCSCLFHKSASWSKTGMHGTQESQNNLKKSEFGGLGLSDVKASYTATAVKTGQLQDTCTDQQNRNKSPEISLHI